MAVPSPYEVVGSAGATTTVQPGTDAVAAFLGGFVAAEGTFVSSGSPPTFRFAVALGATDAEMCELLESFLGVGHLFASPRRQVHYDDEVIFAVQAQRELLDAVVPFMDEHLPESYKRQQYLQWRAKFFDYWEHEAKRRRPCTVEGCEEPRRAHGYCRHHLWEYRRQ